MTKESSSEREPLNAEHYLHLVRSSEAKRLVERFFEIEKLINTDPRGDFHKKEYLKIQHEFVDTLKKLGDGKVAGDFLEIVKNRERE